MFHIVLKSVKPWVMLKGAKHLSFDTYSCCLPFIWPCDLVVPGRVIISLRSLLLTLTILLNMNFVFSCLIGVPYLCCSAPVPYLPFFTAQCCSSETPNCCTPPSVIFPELFLHPLEQSAQTLLHLLQLPSPISAVFP